MKFDDYHIDSAIKKNIQSLGYKKPTDIQYKAIPPILKGEDVMAIAQTGTGKTAAFVIPVLHLLLKTKRISANNYTRCVVMVPTHELAQQIAGVFDTLGNQTGLRTLCIHGGVEQVPQIEAIAQGVDILVATPGRVFDLVSQGFLKLYECEILILDEADHMLDLGFIKDIRDLIKFLPRKRQTLFFSATLNDAIKKLAYSLVHNPIRIQISPKDPVAKNIAHFVAFIDMDDKRFFLERLVLENPDSKILVFVRTKVRAERVFKALERAEIDSLTLHGDKEQTERAKIMSNFRSGQAKVLIATDISARGIDIPDVDFVINYDLPEQVENYVHRVGRTGRGAKKGMAYSFCSQEEKILLTEIEEFLEKHISVLEISKTNYTATLDLAEDKEDDWRSLMKNAETNDKPKKKKK
ncbi:MAG: DEAD/DEAH box helicase [Bacteroidota bacterium]